MESIHELTRSSCNSSSLTSGDSDHTSNREHCKCAAQADEMHNQYLNRLEASFVTQLHRSTSWSNRSMNRNISVNQPGKMASEEFTVFHDGYWEKINFGGAKTADSHGYFKSHGVKHFRHGDKTCSAGPDAHKCGKIGRYSVDMLIDETCFSIVGSTSEGSGQNFVYEDCDNDATFQAKKLKLSVADTSSADQIVPSSETDANIQPINWKIPPEGQVHQTLEANCEIKAS